MAERRGRKPSGNYKQKTHVFSARITEDLRSTLVSAAKESGHSISQEVEHRLRRSFDEDIKIDLTFGGRRNYAVLRMISCLMELVYNPDYPEKELIDDPFAFNQFLKATVETLGRLRPACDPSPPQVDLPLGPMIKDWQGLWQAEDWLNAIKTAPAALPIGKPIPPPNAQPARRLHLHRHTAPAIRADLGFIAQRLEEPPSSSSPRQPHPQDKAKPQRARQKLKGAKKRGPATSASAPTMPAPSASRPAKSGESQ